MIPPVFAHNRWLVPTGLALIVSGVVVLLVVWSATDVRVSGMELSEGEHTLVVDLRDPGCRCLQSDAREPVLQ